MAHRSMTQLEGILEDVLVKVRKFIFPLDFVVIDMAEDKQVSLLLGRPFLAIGAALIDVKKGELTLRVGTEEVQFNLNQSLKQPDFEGAHCMRVEEVIPNKEEMMYEVMNQDPLEECILNSLYKEDLDGEKLNASAELIKTMLNLSEETEDDKKGNELKMQEAKKSYKGLILEELSKHLKYAFLGDKKLKPVIIETDIT